MTPTSGVLLALAGFVAGAINSAAGGGTLIVFPALLAAGVPALTANITASVGLLSGTVGGALAYREELRGQRHRMLWFGLAGTIGGVAGALLLLATPGDDFRTIVPYLLLSAVALLLAGPRITAHLRLNGRSARPEDRVSWRAFAVLSVVTIYGSYFGAGQGVILLAILGIALDEDLQRINALKVVLGTVVNAAGITVFLVAGEVDWGYAAVLCVGAFAGGTYGVRIARRLPASVLRGFVAGLGVAVAVVLIVRG